MFGSKEESKGFNFTWKIKNDKQFSDVPILMMTSINTALPFLKFPPDTDGEYLPVDAFIDKPVKVEEFYQKVNELLRGKDKE